MVEHIHPMQFSTVMWLCQLELGNRGICARILKGPKILDSMVLCMMIDNIQYGSLEFLSVEIGWSGSSKSWQIYTDKDL